MKIKEIIPLNEVGVDSSWIIDLTHDSEDMKLTYNSGNVDMLVAGYAYVIHSVPQDVFNTWLSAESKGSFFKHFIEPKYVIT